MIIYLSGPISSCLDTYKQTFAEAQAWFETLGYIVISPAVLPLGLANESYLPICLKMLDAADAIAMIGDWEKSAGAKMEKAYAEYQGKLVIYDTK